MVHDLMRGLLGDAATAWQSGCPSANLPFQPWSTGGGRLMLMLMLMMRNVNLESGAKLLHLNRRVPCWWGGGSSSVRCGSCWRWPGTLPDQANSCLHMINIALGMS